MAWNKRQRRGKVKAERERGSAREKGGDAGVPLYCLEMFVTTLLLIFFFFFFSSTVLSTAFPAAPHHLTAVVLSPPSDQNSTQSETE